MIRKSRISFILLVTSCLLLVTDAIARQSNYVRVAIIDDAQTLSLKVNGPYEITDTDSGKVLYRARDLKTTVATHKDGILLGNIKADCPKIFIKAEVPEATLINGRRFRGIIQLVKKDDTHILVVNYIDLEDYIKGVLYHEVSHYWPMEALKAQAIVSRSYAVYQMQENKSKEYDVTSDIYSQVYGGRASERYRTNRAVEETYGQILTYQNKTIPAYFHATCGGHTQDASLLWNIDLAPLKGVPCSFCRDSPHFNWHYVLALEEIKDKLAAGGRRLSGIKDIVILGKDKSGQITDLNIICVKEDLKISAKDFRNIIGSNIIRSTNFKVEIINRDAVFQGFGWGHGVGLCQWGAYFMAKQGSSVNEILKYYYPGTDVKTIGF